MLPTDVVALCDNIQDAMALCVKHSLIYYHDEEWAKMLNKSKGEFSKLMNPKLGRAVKPELWKEMQRLAGNKAVLQWLALEDRCELAPIEQSTLEEAEWAREERSYG